MRHLASHLSNAFIAGVFSGNIAVIPVILSKIIDQHSDVGFLLFFGGGGDFYSQFILITNFLPPMPSIEKHRCSGRL